MRSSASSPRAAAERARAELARRELARRQHRRDPAGWIENRLQEKPWSKQREILDSVVEHRYTAVRSCHDAGKSYLASRLVAWWLDVHPVGEAFAVTTAPTAAQVEAILWREIGRAHRKGGLHGRLTGGPIPQWKSDDGELIAYGRRPADYDPAAFQGIHARHVLVVIDEASGVPAMLWDAVDSLATNENARVLAIGNPDDPSAHFAKACAPGSGWHTLQVERFRHTGVHRRRCAGGAARAARLPYLGRGAPGALGRGVSAVAGPRARRVPGPQRRHADRPVADPSRPGARHHSGRARGARLRRRPHGPRPDGDRAQPRRSLPVVHEASKADTMTTAGHIARLLREHPAAWGTST